MIREGKLVEFQDVLPELVDEASALIQRTLDATSASRAPRLIHMCGIPGAGKTTYAQSWLANNSSFATVQFDVVMESLSGYQQDVHRLGLVESFSRWEVPARAIGYHLLQALIESRRDVLFDHSGLSLLHVDLITKIKACGYHVEMHYIHCEPEEAAKRVRLREQIIHRHTPEQLIFERHALLKQLLPTYESVVDVFADVTNSVTTNSAVRDGEADGSQVMADFVATMPATAVAI